MSFEGRTVERPDPSVYLRKREGSPGGLGMAKARSASPGSPGSPGLIRAGSPARAPTASPGTAKLGAGSPGGGKKPPSANTHFRRMYDRGDLPCGVDQNRPGSNGICWKAPLGEIDLHLYLPVFVEGLLEMQEPYRMLATRGCEELLAASLPERLLPVLPQLILPIKTTFMSQDPVIILTGLQLLGALVRRCEGAGPALVPYYRQLLPPLSKHINDNISTGNAMHYGQRRYAGSLGDAVLETLHLLERTGGKDAFLNLKYLVPVYESCVIKVHGKR